MPNTQNQEMLANIKADLEASGAVWWLTIAVSP